MDSFIIKGPSKIKGNVSISGSKNASLAVLFASILTDEKCILDNVPELSDIKTTYELLNYIGKECFFGFNRFEIEERNRIVCEAPYDIVRKMRASVLVSGPLLARFKYVKFSMPGGCAIGVRPIDMHLDGFEKFGAKIDLKDGYIIVRAKKLKPAVIKLKYPSVGATENLMMTASLIKGKTVLHNVAKEPEIETLACVLNEMGAKVEGAGTDTITVYGADKLRGFNHRVISDRIEAGTFMILCACCGGELTLHNAPVEHLTTVIKKLRKTGACVETQENKIFVRSSKKIKPVNIITQPYPGFPTDLQAQWMALMSVADGKGKIVEDIFENRFMHAAELIRMGADIKLKHNTAYINGVKELKGAVVMTSDLRAGAGLLIAAARAHGESKIRRVYHIDRGYEKIELKMSSVGVDIQRVEE